MEKHVTYCCVQNEMGEQCSQALNITAASTSSIINNLSAKHDISFSAGIHHLQQLLRSQCSKISVMNVS